VLNQDREATAHKHGFCHQEQKLQGLRAIGPARRGSNCTQACFLPKVQNLQGLRAAEPRQGSNCMQRGFCHTTKRKIDKAWEQLNLQDWEPAAHKHGFCHQARKLQGWRATAASGFKHVKFSNRTIKSYHTALYRRMPHVFFFRCTGATCLQRNMRRQS